MIEFTVYGEPRGKERPRVYNGHAFTPQKTKDYENEVRYSFLTSDNKEEIEGEIYAEIKAFYKIPKSVSKKRKQLMISGEIRPTKKPDLDNIAKAILDALNGLAYHDDSQVVEMKVEKYWSENPRVEIKIKKIEKTY